MTPAAVRQSLLDEPDLSKELRLNDGSMILVRSREQWLASPEYLIVLVGRYARHIAYRNITSIRYLKGKARRAR